jgi:DNA-binding FadR family transcriptional regulator
MSSPPRLNRVRKAYEQAADEIRRQILSGAIKPGERLPREMELAEQLGVSRPTVREALRVLTSERLVRTAKGATGGSFASLPTLDHLSEFMTSNIKLLTNAEEVTLDELLELREYLEAPAARLAARHRDEEDLIRLHDSIPDETSELSISEQFALNKGFHSNLVDAAGNRLLVVAAQPIFVVLQTNLQRTVLDARDHGVIRAGHERLLKAIREHDEDEAEAQMRQHLADLRPLYERAWKSVLGGDA